MNRELKFRVYSHVKDDDSSHGYLETDSGEYHGAYFFFDGGWRPVVMFFNKEHFAPQQYTGLKDKNGTPIYEGDILVADHDGGEDEANIGVVYFAAGTYMIDGDGPFYDHVFSHSPDILDNHTVIGNKFENSELLKA
jgi:hypothetical protein